MQPNHRYAGKSLIYDPLAFDPLNHTEKGDDPALSSDNQTFWVEVTIVGPGANINVITFHVPALPRFTALRLPSEDIEAMAIKKVKELIDMSADYSAYNAFILTEEGFVLR